MDIKQIVKIEGNDIQIYEGGIYRENFEMSPFEKVFEKFFKLGQKNNDEGNESCRDWLNSL